MRVETERSSGDHSDLGIDSFDDSVGESCLDVGEDAFSMFPYGSCGLDEGFQLGSRGPREPFSKCPRCACWQTVVESFGQSLLEQIGSIEASVRLLELCELGALVTGQVPRIFNRTKRVPLTALACSGSVASSRTMSRRTSSTASEASR